VPLALAVVFLVRDMARGAILRRTNPGSFPFRHHAIGLCPVFHLVDAFLLIVQPADFSLVQLPALNSLIDPLFLIRLPLIDHGCFGLGKGHPNHQYGRRTNGYQYLLHPDLHEVWM
jgi:hypothetical protein